MVLDSKHPCESVSIAGSNDGKVIYVAYNAKRKMGNISCNAKVMDGCMYIYTVESKDKGEHWSTTVIIPKYTKKY